MQISARLLWLLCLVLKHRWHLSTRPAQLTWGSVLWTQRWKPWDIFPTIRMSIAYSYTDSSTVNSVLMWQYATSKLDWDFGADEFLCSSSLLVSPTDKTWARFSSTKLTRRAQPTVIKISLLWNFFRAPVGNTSTQERSFSDFTALCRGFSHHRLANFPIIPAVPLHTLSFWWGKKRV